MDGKDFMINQQLLIFNDGCKTIFNASDKTSWIAKGSL